jgi:hypothetical protein
VSVPGYDDDVAELIEDENSFQLGDLVMFERLKLSIVERRLEAAEDYIAIARRYTEFDPNKPIDATGLAIKMQLRQALVRWLAAQEPADVYNDPKAVEDSPVTDVNDNDPNDFDVALTVRALKDALATAEQRLEAAGPIVTYAQWAAKIHGHSIVFDCQEWLAAQSPAVVREEPGGAGLVVSDPGATDG